MDHVDIETFPSNMTCRRHNAVPNLTGTAAGPTDTLTYMRLNPVKKISDQPLEALTPSRLRSSFLRFSPQV